MSAGLMDYGLLEELRASAAKQNDKKPLYAYGVQPPKKTLPTIQPGQPVLRDRSAVPSGPVVPPKNGRALDLANESPRIDALTLTNKLNHELSDKQARLEGICPVRRELFANCFDDLIRRVTHDCTERGLMLQRIRDEVRLSTDAYRTVFEGSVDTVTNTAWESDEEITNMKHYIKTIEGEVDNLQNQVNTMEAEKHRAAKEASEMLSQMREEHGKRVKSIEDNNAQIEAFIAELKKNQTAQEPQ
eukprot:TRINITY_DN21924_c0_g1_i1.p1 TRINITY_DN21924_c0_g1~~TRINITY_DN21924_c0_g1_i1.p1  ORF type:complete len:245 (+),score=54.25 TRINITY_DN21924_c0_g1_i1:252-986(+)